MDEARANLREAVSLVIEANRALAEEELNGVAVIREPWAGLLPTARAARNAKHRVPFSAIDILRHLCYSKTSFGGGNMTVLARTVDILGGPKVLKRPLSSEIALADEVRQGLPAASLVVVLDMLGGAKIAPGTVYGIVGNARTLQRKRKQDGGRLTPGESDRLMRLARIIAIAEDQIGDRERARLWLNKPNRALGGRTPISLLDSDAGSRLVEQVLERIAHGVVG